MLRATGIAEAGSWRGEPADRVVLDFDDRHRRRLAMTGAGGLGFLLDLAEVPALAAGDALVLEDGRLVAVEAAAESLLEIRARDPLHLARLAWHLGNRHLPTEIRADALRIRADHVIAEMARGLGAEVEAIEAPFQPEGGAYGHGRTHGHDHGHGHSHHHHHD